MDKVPHHSTISQNRKRRFNGTNLFRALFEHILFQCMNHGLVKGKLILTYSTHVKANTSKSSEIKIMVEKESYHYMNLLDYYEDKEGKELESQGMKPKRSSPYAVSPKKNKYIEKIVSTTDPESGFMKRGNKPLGIHYLSHQSTDSEYGIIVDVKVTSGNVNDSVSYLDRIKYMKDHIKLPIEAVGVDSGYDTSLIHQALTDQNMDVYVPIKSHGRSYKVEFTRDEFVFNEKKVYLFVQMLKS